jgi:hypothetical protein
MQPSQPLAPRSKTNQMIIYNVSKSIPAKLDFLSTIMF